ncbi:COG complex component [Anaeromyces robustus]|uniref:Conserved oligomeric Golgi complex subunit 2 n=1 Tax=Anaeromyces robustus TaxID=1754192 RepID=A0A1Y1WWK9_9FUNG|nr:COG complex component [Anaeromyces robustus]|eukprot:ORX77586.1 COG complex component [Anaeromyces robustus]
MEQQQKQQVISNPDKNMSNTSLDMEKINMDTMNMNEINKLIVTFERSAFMNPGFSPETFLMDRRNIELNKIKKDLHEHLKELKVELVELINHNYTDFIDLSTILVGTDKLINNLKYPLINMRRDVEDVRKIYLDVINDLETKLNKRSELREKKACLQLYININNSIKKIEELLKTVTDIENERASMDNQTMLMDCKKIERIAVEYNQLHYFVEKGKKLKFITNIDWKITKIKDNILSSLENMLTRSLEGLKDKKEDEDKELEELLIQCLRTYELIDKIEEVEDIIRKVLVKPFISKKITKHSLEFDPLAFSTFPKNSKEANPLTEMYNKIIEFIRVNCWTIIKITNKVLSDTRFDIFTNSFWIEISTRIISEISMIFAPGIPEVFHKNYNCTMDFVSEFETLFSSQKKVEKFRNSQPYNDFMKHWQLPIYFQIRYKNIITTFEEYLISNSKLSEELSSYEIKTLDKINITANKKLIESIKFCWSDSVYLYLLTHKFWKLTIQLITRYILWVKDYIQNYIISEHKLKSIESSPSPLKNTSALMSANAIKLSQSNTSISSMNTSNEVDSFNPKPYVVLYFNIINIYNEVIDVTQEIIKSKICDRDNMRSILNDNVKSTLETLTTFLPFIQDKICSVLIKNCSDIVINMIKNIPTMYRRTNKEPPTKHSVWVPTIFQSLHAFLDQYNSMDDKIKKEWIKKIATDVTICYTAGVNDTLKAVRELEGSLKRLKKVKKGGFNSSNSSLNLFMGNKESMSDEDKIRLQMELDIKQYGEELKKLGFDISTNKEYKELLASTKEPSNN